MTTTADYYLTMTDSYGDGWNGNLLAFKQGNVTKSFGIQMQGNTMRSYGPIVVTFERFKPVNITVFALGQKTHEVGFELRTASGLLVLSRTPGTAYGAINILGTFCPDCVNLSPVLISK